MEKETIFLRKATGLVRAWSLLDAFSFNAGFAPFVLSAYIFSLAIFWPQANLIPAIILGLIFTSFQCIVYSMLVSAMPRAGGEYIWISRIYSPIVGYVVVLVGWVIGIIHWLPVMANLMAWQVFSPLTLILGNMDVAVWWLTADGTFWASVILISIGWLLIIAGMKWCGRAFSIAYILTVLSFLVFSVVSLVFSQADFIAGYNAFHSQVFNMPSAYQQVLNQAAEYGLNVSSFWNWNWATALTALVPLIAFANSWSMWGAPLYGEVRGGSELKRSLLSMEGCNILNTLLCILYVLLTVKLVGYSFFQSANLLWWYGDAMMPLFPFSGFWISFLSNNVGLLILITALPFMLVAFALEVYLPSIRMLFAMAFDRTIPAPLARLFTKRKIPLITLMVVTALALILTWLHCYSPFFRTLFMNATVVAIISFFFTAIAAILFPYRMSKVFKSSPASKYYIGKIPVISICGVFAAAYFLFLIVQWAQDPLYGVNNVYSAMYFVIVYVGAILFYFFYKWYRKRQGIDLNLTFKEIPVE